jgi:hypothetical protein
VSVALSKSGMMSTNTQNPRSVAVEIEGGLVRSRATEAGTPKSQEWEDTINKFVAWNVEHRRQLRPELDGIPEMHVSSAARSTP